MILTHDEHDSEFLSAMSCTLPVLCCLIVCYIAEIHTYLLKKKKKIVLHIAVVNYYTKHFRC